jgi:hypothetical protein
MFCRQGLCRCLNLPALKWVYYLYIFEKNTLYYFRIAPLMDKSKRVRRKPDAAFDAAGHTGIIIEIVLLTF